MSLLRSAVLLGVLTPACPGSSDPAADAQPDQPVAPVAAERPRAGPVASVERAATIHMPSHFADVLEVHSALIRGSVPDAHAAAAQILEARPTVMLETWAPYVYATHEAAKDVTAATDIPAASRAAAALAQSCGECHTALAARLVRTPGVPPSADDTDDALMRRHKWAFDRLWEGLVLPSDAAWKEGVGAFVDLPACADDLSGEQDREAIRRARETVRSREHAARSAETITDRAQIYGELLATCSSCHASGC